MTTVRNPRHDNPRHDTTFRPAVSVQAGFRAALLALAAATALPSLALTEVKWNNPTGGSYLDLKNWTGGALPVGGESRGVLDLNANYTVTFPDGGTAGFSPYFKAPENAAGAADNKLVLDFAGSFEWLDGNSGNYESEPFKFYTGNGHFFNWESWPGTQYGPAAITNALISLWTEKGSEKNTVRMRIGRGMLGMRKNGALVVGHTMPGGNANNMDVAFEDGATAWFYNVHLRMQGADTRFAVTGGAGVTVANDLYYPANSDGNYKSVLEVSGEGSYLYGKNFCLLGVASTQRDVSVVVTNKGVLQVAELRQNNAGRAKIHVADGGVFKVATTQSSSFLNKANSTIDLCVTNNGVLEFTGGGQWGGASWEPTCAVNLRTSGGIVKFDGNHAWNRDWIVDPGTRILNEGDIRLASTAVTNADVGIFADFSGAEMTGATGRVLVGMDRPARLVLTNGVMDVRDVYVGYNAGSSGSVLVGGKGVMKSSGHYSLSIGGEGISIGNQGGGSVTLRDDGVIDAALVRLGRAAVSDVSQEAVLNIEGGRFFCTNTLGTINVCDNQAVARVNLTGGVLCPRQMIAWNGAHYKNPSGRGYAYFVGNGGVLRAPSTVYASRFLANFDDARVGAAGLTIHSDYDVGIRQAFADLAGDEGRGRITFEGRGTKTVLTGNDNGYTPGTSTHSYTVVAGGTLLFEAGADWRTHLVVTNGATASTAGGCTGLTLKGLTLGDADTTGVLLVDSTDVVVVDGPVSLPNGRLAFSSTLANGTYGILRVKNPETNFPAAERAVWARMVISAGRASGRRHLCETSVDAETGDMTLSITVDDPVALGGDAVWTGRVGGGWTAGGNWESGAKPGELEAAVFSSETAETAVALDAEETVGAVEFDAERGYVVSGDGSLWLSDSGNAVISAAKGSHEIAVDVGASFQLPVSAAEDAKVVLSAGTPVAGIEKQGAGGLEISDLSSFDGPLTLGGGVVTLGDANDAAEKRIAASVVQNPGYRVPTAVVANQPVVLENFSRTSGILVKSGAAPLTVERSGNAVHSIQNDGLASNPANVAYDLTDSRVQATGMGSISVAEGDLVFRGTEGVADDPSSMPYFQHLGYLVAGLRTGPSAGSTAPRFVFDRVRAHAGNHCYFPGAYDPSDTPWSEVGIVVTNGAYVRIDTFQGFSNVSNVDGGNRPAYKIDVSGGGTFNAWYSFNMMTDRNRGRGIITVRDGSYLLSGFVLGDVNQNNNGFVINGDMMDMRFTGASHMGAQLANDYTVGAGPCRISFNGSSDNCHLHFSEGSVLHCDRLRYNNANNAYTNYLHFDDGEWTPGDTDFNFVFRYGNRIAVLAEGAGLVLSNAPGRTWNFYTGITGTDVVKRGEGTLVFRRNAYLTADTQGPDADLSSLTHNTATEATLGISGTLRVESGTVSFADAESSAGRCAIAVSSGAAVDLGGNALSFTGLSGAGVVSNGTLNATLAYGDGTALPTFASVSGGLTVDFGRTSENPVDSSTAAAGIVVGRYSGAAPAGLKVKAVNTGISGARTTVTFADGQIFAKIAPSGFAVLIR